MSVNFNLNGKAIAAQAEPDTPLLWVIRDELGLTGTKFGCGQALCGACTVHLDGQAIRSCITPISAAEGKKIVTIEAATDGSDPVGAAVHAAWVRHDVAQCGYCHGLPQVAAPGQAAHGGRDRCRHGRQHLPLRHLRPHPRRGGRCRQDPGLKEHPPCCPPLSIPPNCRASFSA